MRTRFTLLFLGSLLSMSLLFVGLGTAPAYASVGKGASVSTTPAWPAARDLAWQAHPTGGDAKLQARQTGHTITPLMCCGAGCNPNRTPDYLTTRWDGWQYNGGSNTVGGVYSKIWNYSPYVSTDNSGDFAYSWTMLTVDHAVGVSAPYVQIGWVEFPYGARHTMIQWYHVGDANPSTRYWDPPKSVNTYTYYDVLYNNRPGVFSFVVGGVDLGSSYDISAWFTPTEAQAYGETLSLADQMPGGYTSSADYEDLFDSSYWQGGAWHGFSVYPGSPTTIHNNDIYGNSDSGYFSHTNPPSTSNNISIWDLACPH
jgi:hypothetical protein